MSSSSEVLLEVKNLRKWFSVSNRFMFSKKATLKAVNGVSFAVNKGETLGIVGESGCGKTTLGRTVLRLVEPTEGEINFCGEDLLKLDKRAMQKRRRDMSIIFQDPYGALDPRMKIGDIICEPMIIQGITDRRQREDRLLELLDIVGLGEEHVIRYAHEFSGGQRQRVGIARALALNPKLIVCDEPVSALDVSIQAQILNLMEEIQLKYGVTFIFISHDLSVVKHVSHNVAVMYLGKIVEIAPKDQLYDAAMHPYSKALLAAIPIADTAVKRKKVILQGDLPSPTNLPPGCSFNTRCPISTDECLTQAPELKEWSPGHYCACHHVEK